ncbi:sugar transferase [Macrococcus brunensis]|uniref:Sugar transferase n=1 Tax=Macrococcus brunensis TaxID=198483 RepID=A0A4R6BAS1_9STAP|nr:sugar transferase [Macrococcus brunensis]TDL93405.1 sugar transferase [Macrococcus brunensis]
MKRAFDLSSSVVGLVALSPILVATAIAIKVDSDGPVLFKQKRPGKDNELFDIYKFRSMAVDTPNVETAKLGQGVSYITKVGHFIRRTSIDELPQLINVAKGEMSIVGPRPALFNQYDLIEMRTAVNVHTIKPGITGLAQVMGRDEISDIEKVAYDQYYLEHQTFIFDMWIIYKTFVNVIKSEGITH